MQTKKTAIGILTVLAASLLLLYIFFGNIPFRLNHVFFSLEGDGIQCYFNSQYLANHDSSLFYSHSMNYPYGEISFYTLSQPLVIGMIKFISSNFCDVSDHVVGIINFTMISSIVIAALFLYLIFRKLKLPWLLSALVSTGISFLSPQIDRFGGHYTLAFVWAIPFLLYMLMLFNDHHKIWISLAIGIVLFCLISAHVYFAAIFFLMLVLYWIFFLVIKGGLTVKDFSGMFLHFALQFVLPVLLFFLISSFFDLPADRPSKPYGFLIFKASPESVFLPLNLRYGAFLTKGGHFSYVQWEGVSYIGLTAVVVLIFLFVTSVYMVFKNKCKEGFALTDNTFLNIQFWTAFIILLYSFGIPFIWSRKFLVDLLGPLQQIRALGRFAWPFFYVINILVFYQLWQWHKNEKLRSVFIWISVIILFTDVFFNLRYRKGGLNNSYEEWSDYKNVSKENEWVHRINAKEFQAVIPIPFYHMGSDNYFINPQGNILRHSFLVSQKTSLPIMATFMSRASVSQSLKNITVGLEPYRSPLILDDLSSKKPFLLVASKQTDRTPNEIELLSASVWLDSCSSFDLYALPFDSLKNLHRKITGKVISEMKQQGFQRKDTIYTSRNNQIIYLPGQVAENILKGAKNFRFGNKKTLLYEGPLPQGNGTDYVFSCWLDPVNVDLFPKSRIHIEFTDTSGKSIRDLNFMLGHYLRTVDHHLGLFEYSFAANESVHRLRISVYNDLIKPVQHGTLSDVMLRHAEDDVYFHHVNRIMKNNRWYRPDEEN